MVIQVILKQLEEFYSSIDSLELEEKEPRVGLPCVARFSDDRRFYRAQILEIDGVSVRVLFVDYGNEDQVTLFDLKRILPRFMTFPKLVRIFIRFSLENMFF